MKFDMARQCRMDEIKSAIKNVITKRDKRGATQAQLHKYLERLKVVWKNTPELVEYISWFQENYKVQKDVARPDHIRPAGGTKERPRGSLWPIRLGHDNPGTGQNPG